MFMGLSDERIVEGFELIGDRLDNLANLIRVLSMRLDLMINKLNDATEEEQGGRFNFVNKDK